MKTLLTAEAVQELIRTGLPSTEGEGLVVDEITPDTATVRIPYNPRMLRPGDSVSGPVLMAAADAAMYAVLLAQHHDEMALTSQFNCNFLARAFPGDVIAKARVLKSGRRLVVMQVEVSTTARDDVAALITGSYVLP
jgi:uncharacterized protein (TIGR00369 family)